MDIPAFYRVLADWRQRPYDWQEANCCLFAAEVARCWGVDIPIPRCETVEDAAEWIRAQGARSLYHYLVQLFGKPSAPLQARRGWIVYRKGIGLEGSAIGTLDRRGLFVADSGLIDVPLAQCTCAFNPEKFRG